MKITHTLWLLAMTTALWQTADAAINPATVEELTQTFTGVDIVTNWTVCDELPPLGADEATIAQFLDAHTIHDAWSDNTPSIQGLSQSERIWLISKGIHNSVSRIAYTFTSNCFTEPFEHAYINDIALHLIQEPDSGDEMQYSMYTEEMQFSGSGVIKYPDGRIALQIPNPAEGVPTIDDLMPKTAIDCISITHCVADLADRDLHWSENEVTAYLGEDFDTPALLGQFNLNPGYSPDVITFTSSNTEVASIDATYGDITLKNEGTTIITAKCEATDTYAEGVASYTLHVMKRPLYNDEGTDETIIMTEAGTLESRISELESLRIRSLVVKGPFNGADLAYLHEKSGQGRLSTLQGIDLSEGIMVADNVEYATQVTRSDVGFGSTTIHFIMSDQNRVETTEGDTGLGGDVINHYYFNNHLAGAFYGMENLRLAKLPQSVNAIGMYTFSQCQSLVETDIPAGIEEIGDNAFEGCAKLTDIVIPGSVHAIGAYAFSNSGITEAALGNVTSLGCGAFDNCKSLKGSIDLSALSEIPEYAFSQSAISGVRFSKSLRSIGASAFRQTGISSAEIPSGCQSIGSNAFYGTRLSVISLPETVSDIWSDSFSDTPWETAERNKSNDIIYVGHIALIVCSSYNSPLNEWKFREGTTVIANTSDTFYSFNTSALTKIELPSSLQTIGNNVFKDASLLTQLTLPANLKSIGDYAFSGCKGLAELTINSSVEKIGDYAFDGCSGLIRVNYDAPEADGNSIFYRCESIEQIIFGDHVRKIPEYICFNVPVKSVTLSDGLVEIGKSAFEETQISKIEIPSSVTHIGGNAFGNCVNLTEANIPVNVETLSYTFSGCRNLSTVRFDARNANVDSEGPYVYPGLVFNECNNLSTIIFGEEVEEINVNMPPALENVTFFNPASIRFIYDGFDGTKYRKNLTPGQVHYVGACALCYDIPAGSGDEQNISVEDGIKSIAGNFLGYTGSPGMVYTGTINIHLPESIERFGPSAFRYGDGVNSINLPEALTYLDERCLWGWRAESIILPPNVKTIGADVFYSKYPREITIPQGVESIDALAFEGCKNLTDIRSYIPDPEIIGAAVVQHLTWDVNPDEFTLHVTPEAYPEYIACAELSGVNIVADLSAGVEPIISDNNDDYNFRLIAGGLETYEATVDIYTLNGSLIRQNAKGKIALSPGFYIVVQDAKSHKVIIK